MIGDSSGLLRTGFADTTGETFYSFLHIVGDTSSLTGNDIEFMRLNGDNNLWIIYSSGEVDVFNTITTRVRHISSEKTFTWLNPKPNNTFFIVHEGEHYFAAIMTSLTIFDPASSLKKKFHYRRQKT